MTATAAKSRLHLEEGEMALLIRLTQSAHEVVHTQWGSQRPWLANPTHRQLIALAHVRGVAHEHEEVCQLVDEFKRDLP